MREVSKRIQVAVKGEKIVTLADVERGERDLICYTCGDKLAVKDGQGERVTGKGRRNQARRKHFSHIGNSKCHGEGPAHYRVKTSLCQAINQALKMPADRRGFHGRIDFCCPDPAYGPKDTIKFAPGSDALNREFEQLRHGYHSYDLLHCNYGLRFDDSCALERADCEVSLDGLRTRADIAGKDKNGRVLWVIEIRRTGVSRAAIDHAREMGIPLFVVDVSQLPQRTEEDPWAEIKCLDHFMFEDNLAKGFYPSVTESYNTQCERKAYGMGPDDHNWSKLSVYVHPGPGDCDNGGCRDCEEKMLHECGEMPCPDTLYMFERDIDHVRMYTDPVHLANSHITRQ